MYLNLRFKIGIWEESKWAFTIVLRKTIKQIYFNKIQNYVNDESQPFKHLQKLGSRYGLISQIEYLNKGLCIEINLGTTLKIAAENETWKIIFNVW